jgi:glutathione reductase (NADPH)
MDEYDVVVVGSGTGGQTAAYHLKERGLKTAVVERSDRPGGVCALSGCQPKKWFYEVTETIAKSRHLRGIGIDTAADGEWSSILEQKNRFTSQIPGGTVESLKEEGIDFLTGNARFHDKDVLKIDGKRIYATYYILATGARPMPLPIEGNENIITSDDFLELKNLPQKILFIGGGFISFEFAHFAARLGPTNNQIIVLEVSDRPLRQFDSDMVVLLLKASSEEGIDVRTNIRITSIEKRTAGYNVVTDSEGVFETDLVVHGAGRVAVIDELDLESAGIEHSERGIVVDETMQTSNPQVFAIGDCATTPQLARVADAEAYVAAENISAKRDGTHTQSTKIDYQTAPVILFTYPQYAMVGYTENALIQNGIAYRKSAGENLDWPTYNRIGLKHAAYKILAGSDGRILGAHVISDNASGLINTLKQAMLAGTTADKLYQQSIIGPYPTRESDLIYMLDPLIS